jgi:hypothetical protein
MAQGEGTGQAQTYDFAVTEKAKALGILRPLSLDSSIILGLTVKRNVSFNDAEKNKNSLLVNNLPASLKDEFTAKYSAWEKTWSDPKIAVFSNPREYAKSNEYGVLKDFCNNHGKDIWPLLFAKAQEQSSFIPLLLEDVLLSSSKTEMQAVDMEVGGNQFTYDGSFIYTTNKDRWVSLCKKLLNNF